MKRKKIEKKLVLNKKTVADLSNNQMGDIRGGGQTQDETYCPCSVPAEICETRPVLQCLTIKLCFTWNCW